ncbi:Rv2732c family membrane protein [Corynebacterium bouchesdurhonense]|uniref:Rv2732c family membrane protein n=1 Tax=Corynebacterium bouchesdurhonense TaxID=1720192 RepID=UPI0008368A3F|nr:hypothetical protein [Corynebacterium bouchesdurhonense]
MAAETNLPTSAESLAEAERRASNSIADTPARWVLLACAALMLVSLLLPFAGGAAGWRFLVPTEASRGAKASIAEYLFTWFSLVGLGVCGTLAAALRRYRLAAVGWVLTGMAVVFALMSVWLRRSSATADMPGHGAGIYLAMAAVLAAVFAYVPVITRRGGEQEAIAVERAAAQGTDEVALAQRAAAEHAHEPNPLLVDDRRARAAERRRR